MQNIPMLKWISPLTRVAAYIFIVLAVLSTGASYVNRAGVYPWMRPFQLFANPFGALAVVVALAAIGIWVFRKVYIEIKKRQIPDFELTRATLLFLRKHHILFGWTTIVVATAHGVYYMLRYPDRQFDLFTGLIAWTLLIVLGGLGSWLDKRISEKKKSKGVRLYHFVLGILFLGTAFVHVMGR